MEFSSKVRIARKKMFMRQEDLARALNISYTTINRWENSKTIPNKMARGVFEAFCKKHGINLHEGEDTK